MRDLQQRSDKGMPSRLFHDAITGIDQDQGYIGRRSAGDHIAGILNMTGRIGDNKFPLWG